MLLARRRQTSLALLLIAFLAAPARPTEADLTSRRR